MNALGFTLLGMSPLEAIALVCSAWLAVDVILLAAWCVLCAIADWRCGRERARRSSHRYASGYEGGEPRVQESVCFGDPNGTRLHVITNQNESGGDRSRTFIATLGRRAVEYRTRKGER